MNCCSCSKRALEAVPVSSDAEAISSSSSSSLVHHQLDNQAAELDSNCASDVSAREQLDNAHDKITAEDVDASASDETRNVQNQSKTLNSIPSGSSYEDKRWYPLKQPVEYTR